MLRLLMIQLYGAIVVDIDIEFETAAESKSWLFLSLGSSPVGKSILECLLSFSRRDKGFTSSSMHY